MTRTDRPVTTSDHPTHPSAPAVVPRWEWRTFGDDLADLDTLAPLRAAAPVESDETYVLSMYGDASVKVRGGVLDAKVLQQVSGAGLQLWVPTMKAPFPLEAGAVAAAFAALGAPLPGPPPSDVGLEQLLDDLVAPRDDLRHVDIHKSRRRSVVDDCMVELTEMSAEGTTVRTVAVESPDPDLVSRTIGRLGLDGRTNTCVPRGSSRCSAGDRGGSPSSTSAPTRSSSRSVAATTTAPRGSRRRPPWSPGSAKAWRRQAG